MTEDQEIYMIKTRLPKKLKMLREREKLAQRDVGRGLNIEASNIWDHERGVKLPSVKTLIAYANYYQVCFDWLLCGPTNSIVPDATIYTYSLARLRCKINPNAKIKTIKALAESVPHKHYTTVLKAFQGGPKHIPPLIMLKNAFKCSPKELICEALNAENNHLCRSLFHPGFIHPFHPRGAQNCMAQGGSRASP